MKAFLVFVVLAFAGVARAQNSNVAILTVEFDNRGTKTMDSKTSSKILGALADKVFLTQTPKQVTMAGGLGQSSLFNHQSVVIYTAVGPTTNGKSVLANCQANIKKGFFSGSTLEKSLKKATDTWLPGDSVKVSKAVCSVPKTAGRKMAM
jgi:hypothetical protein